MRILSHYRSVSGLVAISLFLSCFLLSGCKPWFVSTKTLFGENRDRFPAVVLSTQNPHSLEYTFDWDKNTIGGVPLSKFEPDAKYWRLNLFTFKDGTLVGTFKDCKSFKDRTESFTFPELDKLMRADLDIADDPECLENAETYSMNVLLHDE